MRPIVGRMAQSDLERARDRAQKQLEKLQRQFNFDLPAQMQQVTADIQRLERAIAATQSVDDAADLVAKYGSQPQS